ncbi:MAG: sigma-54 dependent transcriptional regulator [Pseudomonadota bacterium]|nr:sigma-54 dependent transcriptional regulator [Pseudomonadota bacterium]
MTKKVLVVDDDPIQRRLLDAHISRMGLQPIHCDGGRAALDVLAGPKAGDIAAIVLDLVMPDKSGSEVMAEMRRRRLEIPVVVQTAKDSVDTVVAAMRAGAFDFVVKPVAPDRLKETLKSAVRMFETGTHAARRPVSLERLSLPDPMASVVQVATKAARSAIPVLIGGETGVGKEWIARAIQAYGPRATRPFVTVNCGALPSDLAESILFGHAKGAFTDAGRDHVGKFREADGGTLLLDEVGELSPAVQVKLLRVLQEGTVDPVGGDRPVPVDVRILSATNRSLHEAVGRGSFRQDLYYRLNAFEIEVPPLRDRPAEIRTLAEQFLARFRESEPQSPARHLSGAAIDLLERFDWPGNIRQLENAVHRAVVLADSDVLQPTDFGPIVAMSEARRAGSDRPASEVPAGHTGNGLVTPAPPLMSRKTHPSPYGDHERGGAQSAVALHDSKGDMRRLEDIEADLIRLALVQYGGRMSEIARRLGIGRSTLYRKMREYDISAS